MIASAAWLPLIAGLAAKATLLLGAVALVAARLWRLGAAPAPRARPRYPPRPPRWTFPPA